MARVWQGKLKDEPFFPKVLRLEKGFSCCGAMPTMSAKVGHTVILVNPSEVVAMMWQVPEGRPITIVETCKRIGRNHDVRACCSLPAGIV
jgi:hypothetical protein